jgi:hypothetical protein
MTRIYPAASFGIYIDPAAYIIVDARLRQIIVIVVA